MPPSNPAKPAATPGQPKPAPNHPRDTPAMRQYGRFKKLHPDCLLFFRIGDFYELFDADAVKASKLLGLTLTQRTAGLPMAGVPYHQMESYLRRLVGMGVRVAIADQLQTPEQAKAAGGASAVIERGVTRVVTPGTLVDDSLLDDDRSATLGCVAFVEGPDGRPRAAVAVADLSTGAFTLLECRSEPGRRGDDGHDQRPALADELLRRGVCELLFAETADGSRPERVATVLSALGLPGTPQPQWHFRVTDAAEVLREQFNVRTLAGFGLRDDDPAIIPAGVIVRYLRNTQAVAAAPGGTAGASAAPARARTLAHLRPPRVEAASDHLLLDAATLRSLEIDQTIRPGGGPGGGAGGAASMEGSLLGIFLGPSPTGERREGCRTAMGKRLLRDWLCRPLARLEPIVARQRCVSALVTDRRFSAELGAALTGVQDVARIAARVALGRPSPRDLTALGRSCARVEAIDAALVNVGAFAGHLQRLREVRADLEPLAAAIGAACVDDPPAHLRDGGLVRDGFDAGLDEARLLERDAGAWLAEYQKTLIETHQLPSLKVGYNRVFGYYIELPKAQAARAPDAFSRRQTLTNAERFVTPELKEFEEKVSNAAAKALEREQAIFDDLCAKAAGLLVPIDHFGQVCAELDALVCLADKAAARRWVAPEVVEAPVLSIVQGRHPVLDETLGNGFVPNDVSLGVAETGAAEGPSLALITGPNMAGKSTFIRQTALLVLLAHAGSFVPAERATVGLTDRVFARVGADDALHAGQSTFMVEMTETANILHHAGPRALVVLDEIGRGTSTLDGLSLAWAITETLAAPQGTAPGAPRGPRTLFATHYHELTALDERLPGRVRNLHVAVREFGEPGQDGQGSQIVFLHRILPGKTDRSYGLHVARLAGIPERTVARARQVLADLSVEHAGIGGVGGAAVSGRSAADRAAAVSNAPAASGAGPAREGQLSLFTEYVPHPAVVELKGLSLDAMTPLEAFDALRRLHGLAGK